MSLLSTRASVAKQLVLILIGAFAVLWMWTILTGGVGPPGQDIDRIQNAALRLRVGQPIYVDSGDPNRYYTWGPLLAWLWIPMTYMPKGAVVAGWMVICIASWAVALWPARRSVPLLLLVGPLTFYGAWVGNVQAPLLALLVWAAGTRWDPWIVGIAASLKASPILLALVWVRSREWRKVAIAVGFAAVLGAPALLSGIEHYPFGLDPQSSLRSLSDAVWVVGTILAVAAVFVLPSSAKSLASAVAVIASRPSLLLYDVGYLLVPLRVEMRRRLVREPRTEP